MANYIYMELQSTVAFKEVDIDQMLQHTSMDDFLRGMYVKAMDTPSSAGKKPMNQHDKLLQELMNTRDDSSESKSGKGGPQLMFDD